MRLLSSFCLLFILLACESAPPLQYPHQEGDKSQLTLSVGQYETDYWPAGFAPFNQGKISASVQEVVYAEREEMDLRLDFYQTETPKARNPLVILLHPGAFLTGSKNDPDMRRLAQDLARAGFHCAVVNYRLLGDGLSSAEVITGVLTPRRFFRQQVYKSLQDVHTAVRFLHAQARERGLDEDRFYLAGYSAGGILSLSYALLDDQEAAAYFDLEKTDCLNCLPFVGQEKIGSDRIRAFASLSGGVFSPSLAEGAHGPILMMHGTEDRIVPIEQGLPFQRFIRDYEAADLDLDSSDFEIEERWVRLFANLTVPTVAGSRSLFPALGTDTRFICLQGVDHGILSTENPDAHYQKVRAELSEFFTQYR
ncbi:MAG: alpha/beta hydrolase [Bacteroidota bacterium]